MINILLGWDGLGFSSFCLVIFYQNSSSLNSRIVTVLRNRLGDGFFMVILLILLIDRNFSLIILRGKELLIPFLVIVGALTKRAQFPFFI